MPISRRTFLKRTFLLLTGFFAAKAFWFEQFFIETNTFFLRGAQKGGRNLTIVQISDLHLQSVNYQLRQLAEKLNRLQPDLICLTGDAIDKAGNLPVLRDFLALLDKKLQKTAILGNWEYWGKVDLLALKNLYAEHNTALLVNETMQYTLQGKTLAVTGVDDFVGGRAQFATAVKGYTLSDYHIVLNHCPQYSDAIARQAADTVPIDFILSGHTHGGQVNLLGYVPFLPQGSGYYVKGWYQNNPAMYVSKGIGTSILPIRFGARAEIAVFHLPV